MALAQVMGTGCGSAGVLVGRTTPLVADMRVVVRMSMKVEAAVANKQHRNSSARNWMGEQVPQICLGN